MLTTEKGLVPQYSERHILKDIYKVDAFIQGRDTECHMRDQKTFQLRRFNKTRYELQSSLFN